MTKVVSVHMRVCTHVYRPCGVFKGDKTHSVREMKVNGHRPSKPMILSPSLSTTLSLPLCVNAMEYFLTCLPSLSGSRGNV